MWWSVGQEMRHWEEENLLPPPDTPPPQKKKKNISGEIWSSGPSVKISFNNFVKVVQQKIYLSEFGLRNPINSPPSQYTSQHENGPFYYELITIHFLSANESICTVLFKIQELLYEFVETKRVITKFYYPSCWLSPGF